MNGAILDAQLCQNHNCVDCGAKPHAGGLRCLPCFYKRSELRRTGTLHLFPDPAPTAGCYARGCRCAGCLAAQRTSKQAWRARRRAAQ